MTAVVIGAGIAGLAAAHRLAVAGEHVVVLEASDRPGGMVAPLEIGGQRIDGGAEAFARRLGSADELCAELGLEVAAPTGRSHIRWSPTQLWPGADGVLGIPASPDDPALVAALDAEALAFARSEPGLPDDVGAEAQTVGELVTARLGSAVVERLVSPLTRGVYGMSPDRMSLAQFAPALRGPGSLYAKVTAARGANSSVAQPVGGLIRLVEALIADLELHGADLHFGVRAECLTPGWQVSAGSQHWTAERVVLACPARPALVLLRQVGVTAPEPGTGAAVSAVLAVPSGEVADAPVGSGVLLGQAIPGLKARSLTHYSAKWPWSRGAADIIRLSYPPDAAPDRSQVISDAALLLGRDVHALDFAVVRWPAVPRALPLAERAQLHASLPDGLRVAGAWVAGNGIEAAIASGWEAAQ
ncbi:MAG: FAD-dependent oxidoreductase [Propionibacteriaceae bacterium]|nr:FAD-dependent oxidoreductase [Propionibacteriaceae bacterium]